MHANYYEAIIQLRPAKKEVVDFVSNQIDKEKIHVSKIETLKTGINIFVSSNKFAMQLGKKLKKSFKGEIKLSRSLHSRDKQTSKALYRVTVCFRLAKPL